MSAITKAKINVREGIIELEGSEAFVSKQLEVFQQLMKVEKITLPVPVESPEKKIADNSESPKKKPVKATQTVTPIPLDIKAKDGKPSLLDFYRSKHPDLGRESVLVFAYYLKEYLKINRIESGHVKFCCNEVNIKSPLNIPQMFYDINKEEGWFNLPEGRNSAEINTAGENYVKYDLPRKKNAKVNKTTT